MFDKIKAFFDFGPRQDMFVGEKKMKAIIQPLTNGRQGLFVGGELVGSYSRPRDAKRGAARRGLSLIDA